MTSLQLYRRRLARLGLPRLQLLVRFILAQAYVTVTMLPTSAEALRFLLVSRAVHLQPAPLPSWGLGSRQKLPSWQLSITSSACRRARCMQTGAWHEKGPAQHCPALLQSEYHATPCLTLPRRQACASLPDLLKRGWLPETGHLPDGRDKLAATADIVINLHGRMLPLHSAVLAAGSGVLRQQLPAGVSAASGAAAVQGALEGHPLPGVLLFLGCLYRGTAAAVEGVEDSWTLASVAALAHALDAPEVLQASVALWTQ